MKHLFYATGNIFCGECGSFLVPELHQLPNGGPNGSVTVRGHKPECSLHGKAALVKLPQIEAIEVTLEASA